MNELIPQELIERKILLIRGQRVMLDSDLAKVYGVMTRRLNEQVKRNAERFPDDFSFVLTDEEVTSLMSQIATSKKGRGGRRKMPRVFTEHGAIMAANVLNSPVAIRASVQVVRAFVRLRQLLATHKELADKLAELEKKVVWHDAEIQAIFEAIKQLAELPAEPSSELPPEPTPEEPKRRIGFHP